jgi:hypothetical protein
VEKALGLSHPDMVTRLSNLAILYGKQGRESEALDFNRQATAISQGHVARFIIRSVGGTSEQKSNRYIFISHVSLAAPIAMKEPSKRALLTAETFSVGQLARTTQASIAVSRMAARFAAGRRISDAAVKLTTGMLKVDPAVGRAEALRRSMLALMNSKDKPHYAHPLFWAPFVVVGEGGVYSAN